MNKPAVAGEPIWQQDLVFPKGVRWITAASTAVSWAICILLIDIWIFWLILLVALGMTTISVITSRVTFSIYRDRVELKSRLKAVRMTTWNREIQDIMLTRMQPLEDTPGWGIYFKKRSIVFMIEGGDALVIKRLNGRSRVFSFRGAGEAYKVIKEAHGAKWN